MEENPLVDFSPAFEDYARHMTGLRERFGYPPRLATPSQVSQYSSLLSSVAVPDPNPDPSDPYGWGLLDPDSFFGSDPDLDPSITKQKLSEKP
jgi:hypothetical protein